MSRGAFTIGFFLSLSLLLVVGHVASGQTGTVLYVATNGNDSWSGGLAGPNSQGNDGPFATLGRAVDAIRARTGSKGITVLVRGGIYRLSKTLAFGPQDSGTEANPLVFKAYSGEHPILSGARLVNNFIPFKGNIQKADLKSISLPSLDVRQIFADEKRQIMARFPNYDPQNPIGGGFLYVESQVDGGSTRKFGYGAGSLQGWTTPNNLEVMIFPGPNYWNNIIPVSGVDTAQRTITLAGDASFPIKAGNRYFFQNSLQELDAPGEWYFDREEKTLYFWPVDAKSLESVAVPIIESIIAVTGNSTGSSQVNIRFEGFTLQECSGSAVVIKAARSAVVAGCTIRKAGGTGIEIQDGNQNSAIGNDIYTVGGAGILVSGGARKTLTPGENRISNNYLYETGVFDKKTGGIECVGVGNVVSHNLVEFTPRMGIRFDGNDHTIEYNHVHHVNQETQDSGAIYSYPCDWTKRGNVIKFNYIHDSGGYGHSSSDGQWHAPFYTWGIYLDDYTSGTTVYGNITANTYYGGVFIHGGRDNIVQNNIIYEGGEWQIVYSTIVASTAVLQKMFNKVKEMQYTKYPMLLNISDPASGAKMSGNVIKQNIIYYKNHEDMLFAINNGIDLPTTISDYNVLFHNGLPLLIPYTGVSATQQWLAWKNKGMDTNSIIADPMFLNVAGGDYTLSSSSPALSLGFNPIPFASIGLYKDPLRASWPDNKLPAPVGLKINH